MSLAAVFAATCVLLVAVHGNSVQERTEIIEEECDLFTEEDNVLVLYSLNKPPTDGLFDDDGFSHNGSHFVSDPPAKSAFFRQVDDMALIVQPGANDTDEVETDRRRRKRNALVPNPHGSTLWPNALIPYEIAPIFNDGERKIILEAMRHWEENTCIRFRPRNSRDGYYVLIMSGKYGGCRSWIGRLHRSSQPQGLTLGPSCVVFPTVVHELGHAIGFYHEHNRADRDEYIAIYRNNIASDNTKAFKKMTPQGADTLGLGYDYASIMHYSSTLFSKDGHETMRARQSGIPIGGANELSPLDILKANKLYQCGATRPPLSTTVPSDDQIRRPAGVSCGSVETLRGGEVRTVQSPGYPSHRHNQRCAWVFTCPKGYVPRVQFPDLKLDESSRCSEDYAQLYFGSSLNSGNIIRFGGQTDGRICQSRNARTWFSASTSTITAYYKTNGRNLSSGALGLQVKVTCLDEDECRSSRTRCHNCKNTVGSFECSCNDGYYHSPAANTCYDINECAYMNGGCDHRCINMGGSYRCVCRTGQYLQTNGRSCGRTRPAVPPRNPIAPEVITPPVGRVTPTIRPIAKPTTRPTIRPATRPTPKPATRPPPPTLPPSPQCGGTLTQSSGSLQTPGWPQTYPFNFNCEWNIRVPSRTCSIELTFHRTFGISGKASKNCPKDHLKIYDSGRLTHTICDRTRPFPIRTASNNVRLVFTAGSSHGRFHRGLKITYRTMCRPVTPLPTTRPARRPSVNRGLIRSPKWPETYPINVDLQWSIRCASSRQNIRISFNYSPFSIEGQQFQGCPKDWLKVYAGLSVSSQVHGPFCHTVPPRDFVVASSKALVRFHSGPKHSSTHKGFKLMYECI